MAARQTMNVSLTQPLRDFVTEQVRSGRFQTASEVVRSALRLLQSNVDGGSGEFVERRADGGDVTDQQAVQRKADTLRSKL
jgi:Arc/MetJ-type ribon-helix-helix transcriptional regulator